MVNISLLVIIAAVAAGGVTIYRIENINSGVGVSIFVFLSIFTLNIGLLWRHKSAVANHIYVYKINSKIHLIVIRFEIKEPLILF